MSKGEEEGWHRRQALMIASQLPENRGDALAVLRLATELVTDFLVEPEPGLKPATVISLVGGDECA